MSKELELPSIPFSQPRAPDCAGRILVVDDSPEVVRAVKRMLVAGGYEVGAAGQASEAIEILERTSVDAVISDVHMPGLDGMGLLRALRAKHPLLPVVLMSGAPQSDHAPQAVNAGASRYLIKPVQPAALLDIVASVIEEARARQRLDRIGAAERAAEQAKREMGEKLDEALAGLACHFQPIVDGPEKTIRAYEALLRSSAKGLVGPGAIIDAAERLGRVHDLSRAIRAAVAADIGAHSEDSPFDRDALDRCDVFVNLHPIDLEDEQLFDPEAPLSRHASRVVLELTERASLGDAKQVRHGVERLRSLGFRIAIDDLGAGYSSLSALVDVEPDVIKLDMSLIRDIDTSPNRRHVVKMALAMAGALRSETVCEGIETAAERRALEMLGISLMQGYHFAKPGRPAPAVAW